jgi:hypothetical protein
LFVSVIGQIIKQRCDGKTACKCWSDWSKADWRYYLKGPVGSLAMKGLKTVHFSVSVTDTVSV